VAEDAKEYFGAKMFITAIPRNVRLAEAPSFGKPILLYDVQSVGAKSYIAVAQELMRRVESLAPDETPAPVAPPPHADTVAATPTAEGAGTNPVVEAAANGGPAVDKAVADVPTIEASVDPIPPEPEPEVTT
jgi:hypothetical protein